MEQQEQYRKVLKNAIKLAKKDLSGEVANYIPELALVSPKIIGASIRTTNNITVTEGNAQNLKFTLQSASKLVVLIGILEEFGLDQLLKWCRVEPSGDDFASIARLDQFGPIPSNPMLNSGAISLCGHIPGKIEKKLIWLTDWVTKLFGVCLNVNMAVLASEKRTGDRNRSLAYLLKNSGLIKEDVNITLETYFSLCSFEATVEQASFLPMILANSGKDVTGKQIISKQTAQQTLAIMATCGLYNESGLHLTHTGMPAKSSVSGFILATAVDKAGIATIAPLVNTKGTSIRGEIILQKISKDLGWNFATPCSIKK